jgi:hypothetical protein
MDFDDRFETISALATDNHNARPIDASAEALYGSVRDRTTKAGAPLL